MIATSIEYRERRDGSYLSVIALSSGEKVGAAWLKLATAKKLEDSYDDIPDVDVIEEKGRVGFLNDIVVNKASRRQGIATELVSRLRGMAAKENIAAIYVHAVDLEGVDPVPFYLKCGFEQIGKDSCGNPYLRIASQA